MAAYKVVHGDCYVPWGWPEDPRLGIWVSNERAYKKTVGCGDLRPKITVGRAARLDALGFAWAPARGGVVRR